MSKAGNKWGLGVPALARARCALLERQAEQGLVQRSEQGLGMVTRYLRVLHACGFLRALQTTELESGGLHTRESLGKS